MASVTTFADTNFRDPVLFPACQPVTDALAVKIRCRPQEGQSCKILNRVGVYNSVQIIVNLAGDQRDHTATSAYLEVSRSRSKSILGDI
jgi:hypothetical protein